MRRHPFDIHCIPLRVRILKSGVLCPVVPGYTLMFSMKCSFFERMPHAAAARGRHYFVEMLKRGADGKGPANDRYKSPRNGNRCSNCKGSTAARKLVFFEDVEAHLVVIGLGALVSGPDDVP